MEDIERALEAVVTTARAHLAALRAHGADAAETLEAYDDCADACAAYEQLLNEVHDESAPWLPELDESDDDEYASAREGEVVLTAPTPSEEQWVAVRVRADYFVEDAEALYAAADAAAVAAGLDEWTPVRAPGDAIAILLGASDPVIGALDAAGLQRGNGTATVHFTNYPLVDEDLSDSADEQAPFMMARDQLVAVVPDRVPDDLDDDDLGDSDTTGFPERSTAAPVPADTAPSLLG
jgi:hypothetical protein